MLIDKLDSGLDKYSVMRSFSAFSIFIFFCFTFVIDSGYSYGPALLVLLSFVAWVIIGFDYKGMHKTTRWLFYAFLFMAVVWGFGYFIDIEQKSRLLDKPIRILLSLLALLFLFKVKPNYIYLVVGLMLGAFTAGIISLYEFYFTHSGRSDGHFNAIQFGGLALVWSALALLLGSYYLDCVEIRNNKIYAFLLILSGLFSLVAVILSGSRGVWLALPVLLFVVFFSYKRYVNVILFAMFSVLLFFVFLFLVWPVVSGRVMSAFFEVVQYFNGVSYSSTGLRLDMWKSAVWMIVEKPFLGWGEYGYREQLSIYAEQGLVDSYLKGFQHAHNHYLDMFAKHGFFGFLGLIAIFSVPGVLFFRHSNSSDAKVKAFALSGFFVCASFAIYSLTQAFLWHVNGITVYSFMVVILWYYLRQSLDEMADKESVRQA